MKLPSLEQVYSFLQKSRTELTVFGALFFEFLRFLFFYIQKKVIFFGLFFERNKNLLVKFFIMKRGRYNRPALHIAAMSVIGLGLVIGPFLADTFPVFSAKGASVLALNTNNTQNKSVILGENVFQTEISGNLRDKIITYTVEKGDTLSTIAQKFGISTDTIRWANDLLSDDLSIGDELKILPVTGLAHKVARGDSVYSIAKKYDTEAQKIVDFPFNDFANPETFSLVAGQILIIPDGVKPEEQPTFKRAVYIASGPVSISAGGFTWPLHGIVSQFASWYHMALDITSPIGTAVAAAQDGRVVKVSTGTWDGGYGSNVEIDNGAGFQSLYAHLSGVNVSIGEAVTAGRTVIGWVGMTGRTTGPHVHFEIRRNGALVNPLSYLQ